MKRMKWLGGKTRRLITRPVEAVATIVMTAPDIVVGQHTTLMNDDPEVRSITMVLEQEGVSVDVTLSHPDETVSELVEALHWMHGDSQP